MDMDEMAQELEEAAEIEGAEVGEYWSHLARLVTSYIDYMNEEFRLALEKEVITEYNNLKKNFKIVEEEQTRTYITRRLEPV